MKPAKKISERQREWAARAIGNRWVRFELEKDLVEAEERLRQLESKRPRVVYLRKRGILDRIFG